MQFNFDHGAPFDKAFTVIQDKTGFVWIGSPNGLFRFDGVQYDKYSVHTQSQSIYQIHQYDNELFFTNDLGVYRISDIDNSPTVTPMIEGSIDQQADRPFYPNNFEINRRGGMWLSQSNHAIGRINGKQFQNFPFSDVDKAQTLAIQEDPNNGIWVLSPIDGLFHFNTATDTFEKKLNIKNGQTLLIHEDNILIGSDALYVYSFRKNALILKKTITLDGSTITAIHVDRHDQYYLGTENGKLHYLKNLNTPPRRIYGANEAHRVEELNFERINEIYVTSDSTSNVDHLWVCSSTGLWLLQRKFFKTVEDLPMNNPISISVGRQGNAYVPMNYLYEITPDGDEYYAKTLFDNLQVNAVVEDKNGCLWVSTTTPRVELIKYCNGRVANRFDFHERGEAIFNLFSDNQGNTWFCQAPVDKPIVGIAKINTQGEAIIYDESSGFSSRVLAIKESSHGEIYAVGIGEKSYLYKYDKDQDRFYNLSPPLPFDAILNFEAHDLTIDDRGVVWLATTDGLLRYDSEKISLVKNDVLGQEEVRGVAHYSNDNIWIATATKGLVFYQQNTSTALGELEGLPAVISAYRCINTDDEGRLWAGTAEGLVYSRISASTLPFSNAPRVRDIKIQGKDYTQNEAQKIEVGKGKTLEIWYTNLSFPSKNVQYEYRIVSEEDKEIMLEERQWKSNGTNNILKVNFNELGNYYLELRARQPGGYQWSRALELPLCVFRPWYLHPIVLFGPLAALVFLIGYYFRFYVRRRFRRLQDILKYSNEKLASKEAQLVEKIREFEKQKEELANAESNIHTLELFIKDMPERASWNDMVSTMGMAVNQADDIDAFEIAFKEKNEIVHKGYSNQERSGFTFRTKPFDPKTSLTCWALANNKEVHINDFQKEHSMYIQEKEAYRFSSMLFIPFTLENDQPVVLCAYGLSKHNFDANDLTMFRILARFMHYTIHYKMMK